MTPKIHRAEPIRHDEARCGIRESCWRPECRAEFGELLTVERFPTTGDVIAYCHRSRFNVLGMRTRAA